MGLRFGQYARYGGHRESQLLGQPLDLPTVERYHQGKLEAHQQNNKKAQKEKRCSVGDGSNQRREPREPIITHNNEQRSYPDTQPQPAVSNIQPALLHQPDYQNQEKDT